MIRYKNLEMEELEKKLRAIDEEEQNKIRKIHECYHYTKFLIKRLMYEQDRSKVTSYSRHVLHVLQQTMSEEEEDRDKSTFSVIQLQ